jgi:hypothetical protein
MLFLGNNGDANMPPCYVTHTLHVLFSYLCPSSTTIFQSLTHPMQCKSHYLSTGTEYLPQCCLHYQRSLTFTCAIFAQPVLLYIINSHSLHVFCASNLDFIPSRRTNISSYKWVTGTILQDCFSLHFDPAVRQ